MYRHDIFSIAKFADMINATKENVSFHDPDDNWSPMILVDTCYGIINKYDTPNKNGYLFYADRGPREKKFDLNVTFNQIVNDLHIYSFEYSKYYDCYAVHVNVDKFIVK